MCRWTWTYPVERLAFILADCRRAAVICQRDATADAARRAPAGMSSHRHAMAPATNPARSAAAEDAAAYVMYTSGSTG